MKNFFRVLGISLSLMLSIGFINTSASADAWFPSGMNAENGTMVATITEGADSQGVSSRTKVVNTSSGLAQSWLCPDGPTTSGNCVFDEKTFEFSNKAILPVCTTETQNDCIEDFSFGTAGSELKKATLIREAVGQKFGALTTYGGLPASGTNSLWDAPGLLNSSGSTKYVLQIMENAHLKQGYKAWSTETLSAYILPVSDRSGEQYLTPALRDYTDTTTGLTQTSGWGFVDGCAFTESGYCAVIEDFAPNSKFSITVRVSNQLTGWFRGRIQKPNVEISKFSETNIRVKMTAEPVSVARLSAVLTPENTTQAGKDLLNNAVGYGSSELFKGKTMRTTSSDSYNSMDWVDQFRNAAKDTAAAITTAWNFSTLNSQFANGNVCMSDKTRVVGVVTTNATALSDGIPVFAKGMLDYKVAGLHYAPDSKTLNEGTYDLIMRSDVARCLYGFTSAPVSAKISITGEAGENKVATTVVAEKDGWIKLGAYGFTFSSPTISVKLSQAKAVKTTITCTKGKLVKKVTGVGPKCPAGYKKK